MLLSLLTAVCVMTACGAAQTETPVMMKTAGTGGSGEVYEMTVAETAAASNYMYEPAEEEAVYDAAAGAYMEGGETNLIQDPARKLIKSVYMDIETKQFDSTTDAVNKKVAELGGYIENSNISYPNSYDRYTGRRSMNLTARIPSDRLEEFVDHVGTSGNVTYKSENVTDVTLQYKDTEGRKNSLLVEQKRLDELMKKAANVEDIIAIEARQSEVRYELESIESQLRTYDNQVDYSTVNVNINEVVDFTPVKEATVWERISEGFRASINAIGEFFKNLFVGILAFSPIIILLTAAGVGIFFLIRALVNRGKNRKAKEKKPSEKTTEESIEEQND